MDDFFEHERTFLLEYHTRIRDACLRADRVMHSHKCTQGPRGPGFPAPSPWHAYSLWGEERAGNIPCLSKTQTLVLGLDVQTEGV